MMFGAKKSYALARGLARGPMRGIASRSRWRPFHSTAKQGYPRASWKSSRNDPAARPRRPPRSNRRKRSRLPLGKALGNGGAWRFPHRARETARIRQCLDYARRSARFSPSRLFAQEDPAACQRRRCRTKLRVRRQCVCGNSSKIMSSVSRARRAGETRARSKTRPDAQK